MSEPPRRSRLSNVWLRQHDIDVARASGSWLHAVDGTTFLDFTSGIAVTSTGHCHPHVVASIQRQAERLLHGQVNCCRNSDLERLAERIAAHTPPRVDTFFFANSGAEITEAAVKLAKHATGRPGVVTFAGGFHGRTHLTMAMTSTRSSHRHGYAPLPSSVFVAPFPAGGSAAEVHAALVGFDDLMSSQCTADDIAAVVVEPVLGEGGYRKAPIEFLAGVRERCTRHGVVFVIDEVQTGFGRTGSMFAIDGTGIEPDAICMAKGIASGLPLAALAYRSDLDTHWRPGSHGGTFGGNPVSVAAALATLDILEAPGFLDGVRARGGRLLAALAAVSAQHPAIVDVRGHGLMTATEFADAAYASTVQDGCREAGLLLLTAGPTGETLRWAPPLTVTDDEIDMAVERFTTALGQLHDPQPHMNIDTHHMESYR
jgi:4-aminobutyrate aminotransferase